MHMRAWDKSACNLSIEDFAGKPCHIGLDLACKIDFAAMVIVFEREGQFHAFMRAYLPENTIYRAENSQFQGWYNDGRIIATPGDVIDYATIEADLIDLNNRFQVQEIAYVPCQALQLSTRMTEQRWQCLIRVSLNSRPISHDSAIKRAASFSAGRSALVRTPGQQVETISSQAAPALLFLCLDGRTSIISMFAYGLHSSKYTALLNMPTTLVGTQLNHETI